MKKIYNILKSWANSECFFIDAMILIFAVFALILVVNLAIYYPDELKEIWEFWKEIRFGGIYSDM